MYNRSENQRECKRPISELRKPFIKICFLPSHSFLLHIVLTLILKEEQFLLFILSWKKRYCEVVKPAQLITDIQLEQIIAFSPAEEWHYIYPFRKFSLTKPEWIKDYLRALYSIGLHILKEIQIGSTEHRHKTDKRYSHLTFPRDQRRVKLLEQMNSLEEDHNCSQNY